MPRTTLIIPAFNHALLTDQCLQTVVSCEDCSIVIVDDASTDTTPEMLARYGDRIRVVRHATNSGFAVSCNNGATHASGDYLVFLNNDTIPQPGWLDALVRYADTHSDGAVFGSKLLYTNNTIQHAGVVICQDHYPRHIYTGFPSDHPAVNKSRRFQIVTAACMLVRRTAFERIGGFDTAFENGFEDVDFCLRLGELGQRVYYCADSVVQHLESVSSGRFRKESENFALYRQRWIHRVHADDLSYYMEDGLLRVSYEGRYPFGLEVSPLLAVLNGAIRGAELEDALQERSREVAELLRENIRLRLELGSRALESPELQYQELRQRIVAEVERVVPVGATVLVVSKGDGALLKVGGRKGWHFPQTERGAYAGHHPVDSSEAISHLEALRARGADHLLIPSTSAWWLERYDQFYQHLGRYKLLAHEPDICAIFDLRDRFEDGQ